MHGQQMGEGRAGRKIAERQALQLTEAAKTEQVSLCWTERFPFKRGRQVIEAASYQKWVDTFMAMYGDVPACEVKNRVQGGVAVGGYYLVKALFDTHRMGDIYEGICKTLFLASPSRRRLVKARNTVVVMQGVKRAQVCFDAPVWIPVLHDGDGTTWMSLTPNEVISQRRGLRMARGEVLIGGLGLGWLARRVAERGAVKHVTVVEKDPDVASFFGESIQRHFGGKVEVVVDDVYDHLAARESAAYDTILMDIWSGASDADFDRAFVKLKREHPRVWGWGYGCV